jgi:hypothetical protein
MRDPGMEQRSCCGGGDSTGLLPPTEVLDPAAAGSAAGACAYAQSRWNLFLFPAVFVGAMKINDGSGFV